MTWTCAEFRDYQKRFDAFMRREGIENLSLDSDGEGSFSWRACECCGSSLGGDRYHCSGYRRADKEIVTFDVCQDCVYYAAYGQLDDESMPDPHELAAYDATQGKD